MKCVCSRCSISCCQCSKGCCLLVYVLCCAAFLHSCCYCLSMRPVMLVRCVGLQHMLHVLLPRCQTASTEEAAVTKRPTVSLIYRLFCIAAAVSQHCSRPLSQAFCCSLARFSSTSAVTAMLVSDHHAVKLCSHSKDGRLSTRPHLTDPGGT